MKFHLSVAAMRASVLACSAVIYSQCSTKKESKAEIESFPIVKPVVRNTNVTIDYVADIESVQYVEIRTRVSGYLEKIHVDEGAFVRKGQLLCTIAAQEYKEELARATAVLTSAIADAKTAELDLKNTQLLVDKNVVSATELEISKAKLDAANAKIREAQTHESSATLRLTFTEIRAPFDGLIDRFPNKAGSLINEGDLITSISDTREVFAYFNFSEQEYLNHVMSDDKKSGDEVQLVLANNTSYPHVGHIETVEGKIDNATGSIALRARFANPDGLIRHGSSGKVRIQRKIDNALLVPQKSTFEIQENIYVYVLGSDSTITMRSFVPKYRLDEYYVVESGVSETDAIIYEGIQRLKEGDKVVPNAIGSSKEMVPAKQVSTHNGN